MAERLSRERIAELRASRKPLTWAELMALLDAYEAQRPRPASEPPQRAGLYLALVCDDGYFWTVSWAYGGSEGWVGDNIVAWLPLPPAPERDDG